MKKIFLILGTTCTSLLLITSCARPQKNATTDESLIRFAQSVPVPEVSTVEIQYPNTDLNKFASDIRISVIGPTSFNEAITFYTKIFSANAFTDVSKNHKFTGEVKMICGNTEIGNVELAKRERQQVATQLSSKKCKCIAKSSLGWTDAVHAFCLNREYTFEKKFTDQQTITALVNVYEEPYSAYLELLRHGKQSENTKVTLAFYGKETWPIFVQE